MQFLVSPVSTGLQQEEKYQNIPRDRWGKWRQNMDESAGNKAIPGKNQTAKNSKNPNSSHLSGAPTLVYSPEPDSQANLLFNATLLRPR